MQYLLARAREASTWAGVAGIVAAFGWQADPQTWGAITQAGMGLAGVAAILLRDRS